MEPNFSSHNPAPSQNLRPTPEAASKPVRISWREIVLHQYCDFFSEGLIYLMVIFAPWAFGTTEAWAIWTMNIAGYALGLLLLVKLAIRLTTSYQFPRWDVRPESGRPGRRGQWINRSLVLVTGLVLLFCFLSAWNARSTFVMDQARYIDHPYNSWLPHSYDAPSSWSAFFNYLAIGLAFWAIRDWLLGKTMGEQHSGEASHGGVLSDRLQRLLWVITVSGGLLAVEGIAQRLSGTGELLFLVRPKIHYTAEGQFGPYAYRSNACQYFNLIWPLSLGLWWTLGRAGRTPGVRHLVLACAALMVICPLISISRLGAATAVAGVVLAMAILWSGLRGGDSNAKARALGLAGLVLLVGLGLGWSNLEGRVTSQALEQGFAVRNQIYEMAKPMLDESPFYGTGPGTFCNLFLMYRFDPGEYWLAQLHNDWLETFITFGWVGTFLVGLALILVLVRWFSPGGIGGGRRLPRLLWLALATCLFQARWDFPFKFIPSSSPSWWSAPFFLRCRAIRSGSSTTTTAEDCQIRFSSASMKSTKVWTSSRWPIPASSLRIFKRARIAGSFSLPRFSTNSRCAAFSASIFFTLRATQSVTSPSVMLFLTTSMNCGAVTPAALSQTPSKPLVKFSW